MDDLLLVARTSDQGGIFLSELSAQTLRENGIEGAPGALYLYEEVAQGSGSGIRVLAGVPDVDAAYRLLDLIAAIPS